MMQLLEDAARAEREKTVALLLSYESQLQALQETPECVGTQRFNVAAAQLDMLRLIIAALQR
jgi:hypothetical protein